MTTVAPRTSASVTPRLRDSGALLEELLGQVCEALQISATQYQRAVDHYEAVGKWLGDEGSPLTRFNPRIYAQGSMALGTTTRPWTDEDTYDLDFVLEMDAPSEDPMHLYRLVEGRLRQHSTYSRLLELKRRCLCLNYAEDNGVFHLDVLPARSDTLRGNTSIEVPDRNAPDEWQPSNPSGFIAWFNDRARRGVLLERADQTPLPDNAPAHAKAVLQRAVQLIKRRRDLVFRTRREDAPRSVVLTTLSGRHYRGQLTVGAAVLGILDGIAMEIDQAAPIRIAVCNPTNADERFCESFKTDEHYEVFKGFVDQFSAEMRGLLAMSGIEQLHSLMGPMFGEKVTTRALTEHANRINMARTNGVLRVEEAAGVVAIRGTTPTQPRAGGVTPGKNTFFGD